MQYHLQPPVILMKSPPIIVDIEIDYFFSLLLDNLTAFEGYLSIENLHLGGNF